MGLEIRAAATCHALTLMPETFFYFAGMSRSRAVKHYVNVCAFLIGGFFDAKTHSCWRPILQIAGDPSTWSNDLWYWVRESLLKLVGGLYRHFAWAFNEYPWLLCNIFDPRVPPAEKLARIQEFESIPSCCLE